MTDEELEEMRNCVALFWEGRDDSTECSAERSKLVDEIIRLRDQVKYITEENQKLATTRYELVNYNGGAEAHLLMAKIAAQQNEIERLRKGFHKILEIEEEPK